MVDFSNSYQRLQNELANLISQTSPGGRLPSEPQLARQLGVSRATLREAMRTFEGQGLIRRKQGLGTFVVGHTKIIESGLEVLESIETLSQKIGLEVSMGELNASSVEADRVQAAALDIPIGSSVMRIGRVILAENRPVAYLVDVLPPEVLTPADLGPGFSGSVLDLLLRRGSPMLGSSRTEINAVAATSEIARSLQIQRGDVLLLFTAALYTVEGKVIDFSYSYFLPGYFRFHVVRSVRQG